MLRQCAPGAQRSVQWTGSQAMHPERRQPRRLAAAPRGRGVRAIGGVAQLGERELCKLEVVGSIPIASTTELGHGRRWAGPVRILRDRTGVVWGRSVTVRVDIGG